ncbi:MAG TPA: GNAT family N-acetyltransferase, partial [Anaerolineae bacterium]
MRPARASDQRAVLAFCEKTFSWGDYIPEVWDKWLADSTGILLVGLLDEQPVGLLHVAVLSAKIAWLEGMRVHPDFRRQGVGTALDVAARARARERGCRLVRLATSIQNIAAQKTLATEGYACIVRFNEWEAKPVRRRFDGARVAAHADAERILEAWRASPLMESSRDLLPDRDWHWHALSRARLSAQIDAGELRAADGGFAILLAFEEKDWSGLSLHALAGDDETAYALALAARGEAKYRGFPRLEALLGDDP